MSVITPSTIHINALMCINEKATATAAATTASCGDAKKMIPTIAAMAQQTLPLSILAAITCLVA